MSSVRSPTGPFRAVGGELVTIVAVNTFTDYINALVQTKVDFPAAPSIDWLTDTMLTYVYIKTKFT